MSQSGISISVRLSLFYAAIFTGIGIHMPFWPVWLQSRGLDASDIGVTLALAYAAKIVGNPIVGHVVDRFGRRKHTMIGLAIATAAIFPLFALAQGFVQIAIITFIATALWTTLMPVGENLTLMAVRHYHLDYGRIRLWGSLAFIIAAVSCGRLLNHIPASALLWLIFAGLVLTILSCFGLPDLRRPPMKRDLPKIHAIVRDRDFRLMLIAASLIQASHMAYYGFSTLYWQKSGLSETMIGLLWAEGVVAEIILFAFAGRFRHRLPPERLLWIAAAAGLVRWSILAVSTDLGPLIVAQSLHAATFGCLHLASMGFISQRVPQDVSARAQGLYSSIAMGITPGLAVLASGHLYAAFGQYVFLFAALLSALALIAARALSQSPRHSI